MALGVTWHVPYLLWYFGLAAYMQLPVKYQGGPRRQVNSFLPVAYRPENLAFSDCQRCQDRPLFGIGPAPRSIGKRASGPASNAATPSVPDTGRFIIRWCIVFSRCVSVVCSPTLHIHFATAIERPGPE